MTDQPTATATTSDSIANLSAVAASASLGEALAASPWFTDEEKTALAYASMPLIGVEKMELLHFLGWPDEIPGNGYEGRILAVFERILELRGIAPVVGPNGLSDADVVRARIAAAKGATR